MGGARTRYSEIVDSVKANMWQQAGHEKRLGRLERMIKDFKKMLAETTEEHYDSGLYTLKYYRLDRTAEDIQRFGPLCSLDNSPYEHFNMLIKQAYKGALQRNRTRMTETVNVLKRS